MLFHLDAVLACASEQKFHASISMLKSSFVRAGQKQQKSGLKEIVSVGHRQCVHHSDTSYEQPVHIFELSDMNIASTTYMIFNENSP